MRALISSSLLTTKPLVGVLQSFHPWTLRFCIHTIVSVVAIWCILCTIFLVKTTDVDFNRDKNFKQGFENKGFLLSVWVTVFQVIYFGSYSVTDVLAIYGKQSKKALYIRKSLYYLASYFLFSVVFPMSTAIFLFYWGLYLWDSERMYPKIMDEIFPRYLNHMMHTAPLPASIVYMFTDVRYEPSKSKTLPGLISFMAVYVIVFFEFCAKRGIWVYPVFEVMTSAQIICLIISVITTSLIFFFFGYYLYTIIKEFRSSITLQLMKKKVN